MSARDELARVVDDHRWVGTIYTKDRPYECVCGERTNDHGAHRADAILAAGYRKPRTVTTKEELDALPSETIIRCEPHGPNLEKGDEDCGFWFEAGYTGRTRPHFPATVLYVPEVVADGPLPHDPERPF